jgi:mannose PTS system EIIA component
MVGILIVSHYTLAESLKETVSLIIGKRENVAAVAVLKDDSVDTFAEKLKKAAADIDSGAGVLILADMFGGTPSNVALTLFGANERVQVITGFNLPLVIEAIMHSSDKDLDALVKTLMEKRDKTIVDAKAILRKNKV